MKIFKIWEKAKNEPRDVQRMILASLNGQLEVVFEQVVNAQVMKLGVIYDNDLIANYDALILFSDECLHSLGLKKHSDLMLYRELILAVDTIRVNTEDDYGNPSDYIDIEAVFTHKHGTPSKTVKDLLWNIMDKVQNSEFIDIEETNLSSLKKTRKNY